jgi:protein TonB
MTYQEHISSARRAPALLAVLGLHGLILLAALSSGYLRQVTVLLPPPRVQLEPMPPPASRTPEVLKLAVPRTVPKPPPLEPPPPPVITTETASSITPVLPPPVASGASPVAQPAHVFRPASMDPRYPLRLGEAYYPDASRRLGEEGRCTLRLRVGADGLIQSAALEQSSGSERLDAACLAAVRGQRMRPASDDGRPVESTVSFPIRWQLAGHR